ncbi:MAG: hypothetical protein NVS3B3_23780 [Aquirhabdus sp.]
MLVEASNPVEQIQIKLQLKKNAYVKNSEGKECYFRYYDSRAFSRFIRVATSIQLRYLFGSSIEAIYWIDTATNGIMRLSRKTSSLIGRLFDSGNVDFDIQRLS